MKSKISIVKDDKVDYPDKIPFDPPEYYSEYPYENDDLCTSNRVYSMVRSLFAQMRYDIDNFNTSSWNPLRSLIKPGDKVVIKTNLVSSRAEHIRLKDDFVNCVAVHGSVIRPVIDYAFMAAGKEGKITIVDSPIEGNDFNETAKLVGIEDTVKHLRKEHDVNVNLLDLRDFRVKPKMIIDSFHIGNRVFNLGLFCREQLPGDPKGYTIIDLGRDSMFTDIPEKLPYLRFYRPHFREPTKHHTVDKNEYSISNTVLSADVIINLAKMKTHKKTGVTLSLKSVIGMSNRKTWLPHFIEGSPPNGDDTPAPEILIERLVRHLRIIPICCGNSIIIRFPKIRMEENGEYVVNPIFDGSWHGNDTLWRTILDMNVALFYSNIDGKIHDSIQRKYLSIIDGIISGEGEGPLNPKPVKSCILAAGIDPVALDSVVATIMGFDTSEINHIKNACKMKKYPLGTCNLSEIELTPTENIGTNLNMEPPSGWKDKLERTK